MLLTGDDGNDVATALRVPNKHLALLIIWSFLAGYSQTLVPSLLTRTEARAGNGQ